jgi:hypothetical protein
VAVSHTSFGLQFNIAMHEKLKAAAQRFVLTLVNAVAPIRGAHSKLSEAVERASQVDGCPATSRVGKPVENDVQRMALRTSCQSILANVAKMHGSSKAVVMQGSATRSLPALKAAAQHASQLLDGLAASYGSWGDVGLSHICVDQELPLGPHLAVPSLGIHIVLTSHDADIMPAAPCRSQSCNRSKCHRVGRPAGCASCC